MAYSGYRIKIDNVILKNNDIAKGSYALGRNPRVAKSYTDISGISHEIYYPSSKTVISFSIREHLLSDHAVLASYFANRSVSVEYFDDETETYKSGTFKVADFTWKHLNTNPVMYGATAIKLEEW